MAGLDIEEFEPVEPELQPPGYADTRMAWSGVLGNRGDTPVRIEAASLRGKPVYFREVVPTDGVWKIQNIEVLEQERVR